MADNFADRLIAAMESKRSCVVVGLDPRIDALPEELAAHAAASEAAAAEAIIEFNRGVIEAVAPHAVAVKPQSAFYEMIGWQGVRAYAETIRIAQEKGLLAIADVKRSDIGSTAEAYAQAHLDRFGADAVTVNPYLGTDGIAPFLKRIPDGKGLFILVKTSNPSSSELQDLSVGDMMLYEKVAMLVEEWGAGAVGECGYSPVGAVVGATYPDAAEKLRNMMPHAIFLVPGYGAQGGSADDCRPCFDKHGRGAVVNSSRGIIFAYVRKDDAETPPKRWQDTVEGAAMQMKESLERVRCGPA